MSIYDYITVKKAKPAASLLDQNAAGLNLLLRDESLVVRAVTITYDPKKYFKPHRMAYRSLDHYVRKTLRDKFHKYKNFGYSLESELSPKNLQYHNHGIVVGSAVQIGSFINFCRKAFGTQCKAEQITDMMKWQDYCLSRNDYEYKSKYKTNFRKIIFVASDLSRESSPPTAPGAKRSDKSICRVDLSSTV